MESKAKFAMNYSKQVADGLGTARAGSMGAVFVAAAVTPARSRVLRVVVRVFLFWMIGGMIFSGAQAQAEESQPPSQTHKTTKSLRLLKWRHVPAHNSSVFQT